MASLRAWAASRQVGCRWRIRLRASLGVGDEIVCSDALHHFATVAGTHGAYITESPRS